MVFRVADIELACAGRRLCRVGHCVVYVAFRPDKCSDRHDRRGLDKDAGVYSPFATDRNDTGIHSDDRRLLDLLEGFRSADRWLVPRATAVFSRRIRPWPWW